MTLTGSLEKLETQKFNPETFVAENATLLSPEKCEELRNHASGWQCVDGRNLEGKRFACPGAGLGIHLGVLAGIELYQRDNPGLGIKPEEVAGHLEELFGVTCHTDEHAAQDACIFAGCGHCNGAIKAPDQYGISPETAKHLEVRAQELANQGGLTPDVLKGSHGEQAVFVVEISIEGEGILLPGTGKDGSQAFICHLENFLNTAEDLAIRALHLTRNPSEFSEEQVASAVREATTKQVTATLEKLAKGLPRYRVFCENGQVQTELIQN